MSLVASRVDGYTPAMTTEKVALVVGIDEYPTDSGLDRLNGCVNDSQNISDALSLDEYDFDVRHLINGQGSRKNILREMRSLTQASGHTFVFYFAGHGAVDGGAGYLCTWDSDTRDFDYGIPLTQIAQMFQDASERFEHVILILDSCHSGAAEVRGDQRPLTASQLEREFPAVNASRILLAACRPEQSALEINESGIFTSHLVSGMLDGAVDFHGNVTALSLYDYISGLMTDPAQVPVLKGDVSGSVILGSGFTPRIGSPLDSAELNERLGKAQRLIDEYQRLHVDEMGDSSNRASRGMAACAVDLADRIRWFDNVEIASPDLIRNPQWQKTRATLRNFLESLSHVMSGDNLDPIGRVSREIGRGGYGSVWELDTGDNRLAFKVFHGADLGDKVKPKRFRNGYHSMRKLKHPRIVSVFDLTEAPFGFTMQLIDGSDLRDFSPSLDRSDAENILSIALEVADTIRFAHDHGVIHRDIKPENVIMGWDGDANRFAPYLTDFDLAYIETNQTVTMATVGGVINYAAPEQFFASNSAIARDAKVDVYAFSQLMYFIVLGRDPQADRPTVNLEAFRSRIAELFSEGAATELYALYERGSHERPSDRLGSMAEVCDALLRAQTAQVSSSATELLQPTELIRKVAYSYVGIGKYTEGETMVNFRSRSGALSIELSLIAEPRSGFGDFAIRLDALERLAMPGVASSSVAMGRFDQRIDKRLAKFSKVKRMAQKRRSTALIEAREVPCNIHGSAQLAQVLAAVVSALEDVG